MGTTLTLANYHAEKEEESKGKANPAGSHNLSESQGAKAGKCKGDGE
jgi:hypothetical protein